MKRLTAEVEAQLKLEISRVSGCDDIEASAILEAAYNKSPCNVFVQASTNISLDSKELEIEEDSSCYRNIELKDSGTEGVLLMKAVSALVEACASIFEDEEDGKRLDIETARGVAAFAIARFLRRDASELYEAFLEKMDLIHQEPPSW